MTLPSLLRSSIPSSLIAALFSMMALQSNSDAHDATDLSSVEIRAQSERLSGIASTGSEGVISAERLQAVPLLRPGEALEMVPGLIVTQHAGDGKANQYFLRGFNLDHGTDFASDVAGVPVNMPTHAHGQGYSDLNFLIPELVDRITYRKGPYYAEEGDFASAGAAHIDYARKLKIGLASLTLGENGYARSLLANSQRLADGTLLYALEVFHNDGPWQVPENYRKLNAVLRYSQGTRTDGFSITGMAYQGRWTSTDQVPQRAVESGQLDRYASLDARGGGDTTRYSLSADWSVRHLNSLSKASVWWLQSRLDLWSNFQYCLNSIANSGNCALGDQFQQSERRQAIGFSASHSQYARWGSYDVTNAIGVQGRSDDISPIALYNTAQRTIWNTVRSDQVTQRSLGLWAQNEVRWTPWLRSIQGVRGDAYDFHVTSNLAANSGKASDQLITPKLSLVFGPWQSTEFYANYGHGFHSNDARGSTISVDPSTGASVEKVAPLVRTKGGEFGLRSEPLPGWQSTLALWRLDAASELVFVGDAGATEASRPSRRYGIEWSNFYALSSTLALDADLAWSHARFSNDDPVGDYIPGAVTTTANLGLTANHLFGNEAWSGALRLRYFGPRALIENNSQQSQASLLVNLRLAYAVNSQTQVTTEIYNLFNRRLNDIEYWYESQLANESSAQADRHIHPGEPRTLRLTLTYRF